MTLASRFAAAVTVLLPLAGASLVFSSPTVNAQAQAALVSCEDAAEIAVLPSPVAPWKGAPLRVIFAAEKPLQGELSLIAPDGQRRRQVASTAAAGRPISGSPKSPRRPPAHGRRSFRATAPAECSTIARQIVVAAAEPPRPAPVAAASGRCAKLEPRDGNLYSAWIEKLFDAPLDAVAVMAGAARRAARSLAQRPAQSSRSATKTRSIFIRPDCADLPYFLRAYFAFKMGLPYGYAKCTRGGGGEGAALPGLVEYRERRAAAASRPEDIIAAAMPPTCARQSTRRSSAASPRPTRPEPGDPHGHRSRTDRADAGRGAAKRLPPGPPARPAGLAPASVTICNTASPMACIPAPGARALTTTAPISIPCR